MSATTPLRTEQLPVPGGVIVRVFGDLDGSLQGEELVEGLSGLVVFDLDGAARITSFGVREWLAAMKALRASGCALVRVRPSLVAQLNMVAGFAGQAAVASLYLPYACDACGDETSVLVDLRTAEAAEMLRTASPAESVPCPSCGEAAELDDVPESYLAFARERGPVSLPETLDVLVDRALGRAPKAALPFRAQKEVTEQVTALWLQGAVDGRTRLRRLADGLEGSVVVVLAGVTALDEEGARKLTDLAATPSADVRFARVPPALVEGAGPRARALLERASSPLPETIARYLAERPGAALPDVAPVEISQTSRAAPSGQAATARRYEVLGLLGRGGMAEVFVAQQRGPEGFVKRVALKRILPELAADEHFTQLLLQEARVAAAIAHPNVVQIFDVDRDDDGYYIAMELVDGWDLRTVLSAAQRTDTPVPVELALRVAADVCAGLHAAHTGVDEDGVELGIVHRDVSPHNVLVSKGGTVKLTDFGVSKVAQSLVETRAGSLKGKVVYMAPEQIDPQRGEVDPRTDVWAAGTVLWEMLSGAPLFRRETEYMSLFAVLNEEPAPIASRRPDVPAALDAVLCRALARDPAARYPSARALQLALEDVLLSLGRASTAAHLAQFLERLAQKAFETGGMEPFLTPTNATASLDGGVTLRGTLRRATAGGPPRDDDG